MDLETIIVRRRKALAKAFAGWRGLLPRRTLQLIAAAMICGPGGSEAKEGDASAKPFNEIYTLSAEEALKGQPVESEGTVLCYDLAWGQLYIHDGSNAIYFDPNSFTNRFEVGQFIKIKGTTTWNGTGALLTNATAVVIGHRPLPRPAMLNLAELAKCNGQWIEIWGQVHVAEASRDRVTLVLKEGDQECLVYVMQTSGTNRFRNLVDSRVRIQGINGSRTENGRLNAAILFSPGINYVKVITASQNDRWQLPVTAIDALLTRPLGDWTNQPVHVNGLVSAYQPGASLTIKDPTGLLTCEVVQLNPALLYQRLDAWGFLSIKTNQTVLAEAYFEINSGARKEDISVEKTKADPAEQPVLTSIRQIRSLSKDKANENLPARIRGVLTCVDLEWHLVFLQNGRHAIFLATAQNDLQPGEWVEVTGQTDGTGFAPQLINCSTRILGTTNTPNAPRVDLQDVADGQLDSHWVEMEGVVRRAGMDGGRICLTLASPTGKFTAIMHDGNTQPGLTELIDSLISVRGACGSVVNSRGQISGVTLHVPSRNDITVIDPRPTDPFSIAPTPIAVVATFNDQRLAGRRIKVTGVVTLVAPGGTLFLQDASGGMRIRAPQIEPVQTGERIEALGFPAVYEFSPCLEEAVIRHAGASRLPEARHTTALQILQSGKDDGSLVTLEATVLERPSKAAQPKLLLQDGPIIFTAQMTQPGSQDWMPELIPGSQVRVRGVCAIQGNQNNEPAAFHVLLRGSESIAVTKSPPWWTPRYTLILVAGTIVGALLASVWLLSLRRQVRSQTETIRWNQKQLIATSQQLAAANTTLQKENLERKEAEATARRSEELYRGIADEARTLSQAVEQSPASIVITDRDGKITYVNSKFAQATAYSFQEAVGQNPRFLKSGETPPEEYKRLWETITAGREWHGTFHNRKKNGELYWESASISPVFNEAGQITHYLAIKEDITERKQAEEALRSQEERTRLMIDQAFDAVVTTDADYRIIGWNRTAEKTLGWTRAEILGRNLLETIVPPSRREKRRADLERFRATGEWADLNRLVQTTSMQRDGRELPIELTITPIRLGDNWIFALFLRDITERKQAEVAIAREREFLESLLENSPDSVYFKDRQSRFLRCSKIMTQRFGCGLADLIGKSDFDLFTEEHARPAFEDEQEIIRTGCPLIGKVEREVAKDGRESWALTSKMPLRNKEGEIVGTFGISKDVTAIKEAEVQLEQTHKELVQASRIAGMAEVATSVLHNVGNVLNSINVAATLVEEQVRKSRVADVRRLANLLEEHAEDRAAFLTSDPKGQRVPDFIGHLAGKLDSEQAAMLEEISSLRRNVEHVKEIIAMQQSYARVSGALENINVADLLEDALRMNAGALARHEVKVVREFGVLPPICTDKHKVLQILINLVRNAKYACDESGRSDKQLILRAANGDGRVKIAIIDNGVGIPPENLTRIFNHGFTTRKDGHGFGLHSGALAAKELGGSLTACSEGHGRGAAFTLELPCQPPAGSATKIATHQPHDAVATA